MFYKFYDIYNSEYDEEIPQSQTADKPVTSLGRASQQSHATTKTNKAKQPALSSSKMIAKIESTQCKAQQNIEQLQNPTLGVTINISSTPTEPPPKNGEQPEPPCFKNLAVKKW